ncbi:OmpA family protein [Pseudoruegeria sp. HB172150]|uniref:OmpA family protein n=1 Tax=Pseudoruegeria sp. HB172150 TaxID=2721164 RepID=UPI001556FC4A|nr:OmpA family protein [Pseudoruegeria sp. HB172150]
MKIVTFISAMALFVGHSATAQELVMPADAARNAQRIVDGSSHFLPTAPFVSGAIDGVTAEGRLEQTAWKLGGGQRTTMEILASLREQLTNAGFTPIFECETDKCGGFDFRYGIDVLPEPEMHVNLGDFRYFAAKRGENESDEEFVSLLVSRSGKSGFVQFTHVGEQLASATLTASTKTPAATTPVMPERSGPVGDQLESQGHATLGDLAFVTGSSKLGSERFDSLENLATYLQANPDRTIMLVGHTDAEGPLANNIALSRRRAAAVLDRLVGDYEIPRGQVSAEGVGYLAPRASNLTPEGRTRNRRVEVILTSTQ